MKKYDFPQNLTSFFSKYLPGQRGVSINTIKSYRDTFVLFFRFLIEEKKIKPDNLTFVGYDIKLIKDFLEWIETKRQCSAATRNQRLAAIHAFTRYVMMENPEMMHSCQEILSIQSKKAQSKALNYLTIDELKCILAQPDLNTKQGKRDLALLTLLYDSGARVQEIADLKIADIRLELPATLKLTGKGNKSRIIPIMPDTAKIMSMYMKLYRLDSHDKPIFMNKEGKKLSRSGIEYIIEKYAEMAKAVQTSLNSKKVTPHVFRHSKGMHLTQANVNIIYIRDLFGHSSVQVTERYAKADTDMKRKALEKASENILPKLSYSKEKEQELMTYLKTLV
jgi:site-specific recombinase XerD